MDEEKAAAAAVSISISSATKMDVWYARTSEQQKQEKKKEEEEEGLGTIKMGTNLHMQLNSGPTGNSD